MENQYTFGFLQFKKGTCTISRVPLKGKVTIPASATAEMTSRNDGYFLLHVQHVSNKGILTCVPETPIWPAKLMSQALFHATVDRLNGFQLLDFSSQPRGFAKLLDLLFTEILKEEGSAKNPSSIFVWRIIRNGRLSCSDSVKARDVIIQAILKDQLIFSKMVRMAFTIVEPSYYSSKLIPRRHEFEDGCKSFACLDMYDLATRDAYPNVGICDEDDIRKWEDAFPACMTVTVDGSDIVTNIDPSKAMVVHAEDTGDSGVTAVLRPFPEFEDTITVKFHDEDKKNIILKKCND